MKKSTILFFIMCTAGTVLAQRLPVQTFTTRDGLVSNFITEIYQDSKGYLWIGTDEGVSIFDGDKFKNIRFDETKVWGYVNDILESKVHPGQMWIATNGGGLIRYMDGETESYSLGKNPFSDNINSIIEMEDGSLWCGTDDGLYHFKNNEVEHLPSSDLKTYVKFTKSLDGTIWCFDEMNLFTFSPDTKTLIRPRVKDLPLDSIIHVSALADSSVVVHVRRKKNTEVFIVKDETVIKKYELFFPAALFTVLGPNKQYWIGTTEGLQMVQESVVSPFFLIYTTANGLPVNELTIGYQDREQNIWFGSFGRGITKLETQQSTQFIFPGMSGKGISDRFAHIWIPSSHGLYEVWKDSVNQWKKFLHVIKVNNKIALPIAVAVDSNNHLWITDADGQLSYLEVVRDHLTNSSLIQKYSVSEESGFPRGLNISLFIDSKNILWYGLLQGGVAGIDYSSKPKLVAQFHYQKTTQLRDVRALYEDRAGNIWAMGFDPENRILKRTFEGIVLDSTDRILTMLPKIPFRSILETNDGTMWFGSRYNGLFYYRDGKLKQCTTKDGLISNQIWSLAETPNGGILIGTQAGLMLMPDHRIERFTSLQQYTESPVQIIASTPQLTYALTRFELTMFDIPNNMLAAKFPQVLFTSIFVNGNQRRVTNDIELSSTENTITIDYTAISFRNTGALRFQYKLEPLEEEWHIATTNRSVTYAHLSPGNYIFAVRALNQEGKPSEVSSILSVSIATPLWMRWWFISLMIAAAFGVLAAIERVRVRRLLEIEKIRSRIAADLHDDIGSGLTRIALLSDMIHRQAISEKKQTDLQFTVPSLTEKVGAISRELVDAMSDVVWSIDPTNSSMERLLHRVQTFAVEVCEAKEIELQLTVSDDLDKLKVGSDSIRAVLLVVKEALTNVVRHSNAKNVAVSINAVKQDLVIEISDDGKGFDINELSRMNGLTNMRLRIEKIGGLFTLNSNKGKGTAVFATIPLHR